MTQSRFIAWFLLISVAIGLSGCSEQLSSAISTQKTATPSPRSSTVGPADGTTFAFLPLQQTVFSDPGGFIGRAYDLLVRSDLEHGFSPDYAHSTLITFPSGDKRVFVSIGFSGVTRGYLILLRLKGDGIEPLQVTQSDYDWGAITDQNNNLEETSIESLELLHSPYPQPHYLFRVSGWSHMGSGLTSDVFQIVELTDGGIRIIFTGILDEVASHNGGYYNEYRYDYTDLDGDGDKEITQIGRECQVQYVREPTGISDCDPVRRVWKYNGIEYVQLP